MKRRELLRLLALAPVALKLSPLLPKALPRVTIAEYCEYTNFSDFALMAELSPELLRQAQLVAEAKLKKYTDLQMSLIGEYQ